MAEAITVVTRTCYPQIQNSTALMRIITELLPIFI